MELDQYEYLRDARKVAILESCSDVFAEFGYEGASLAQLASACGLSQPGLLHHFPSKKAVLLAVLVYRDVQSAQLLGLDLGEFTSIEDLFGKGPGGLALLPLVKRMFRTGLERRNIIALFAKIASEATNPEHPGHAWAVQRFDLTRRGYELAFIQDAEAGRLRAGVDPAHIAKLLVAVMDGLQLQWLLDPAVDAADTFDLFVDALAVELAA